MLGVYSSNAAIVDGKVVNKAANEIFSHHRLKKSWPRPLVYASVMALMILLLTFLIKNNYLAVTVGNASLSNAVANPQPSEQVEAL